jgi:hypothetical protein
VALTCSRLALLVGAGYFLALAFRGRPIRSLPGFVCQYGDLHFGQRFGCPSMFLTHLCPHRRQSQIMLCGIGIYYQDSIVFILTQLCYWGSIISEGRREMASYSYFDMRTGKTYCGRCDSGSWSVLGDCSACGDGCCDDCATIRASRARCAPGVPLES